MTRSSFPCFTIYVKSIPYFSKASYFPFGSTTSTNKEVLLEQQKRCSTTPTFKRTWSSSDLGPAHRAHANYPTWFPIAKYNHELVLNPQQTEWIFWLSNRIYICIICVIWILGSPFPIRQNQFNYKESYEALTHHKHHTWKSQKEWGRGTCAMIVFATLVLLLLHIVQLYNHEWHDDSHNSSKKWCHNWVNFTMAPHPAISSLGTHTTS